MAMCRLTSSAWARPRRSRLKPPSIRLITLLVLSISFAGCGDPHGSDPAPVGVVQVTKGSVRVSRPGHDRELTAGQSASVQVGDEVMTGPDSEAVIRSGPQVHLLSPSSRLELSAAHAHPAKGLARVSLLAGLATFLLPVDHAKQLRFQALSGTILAAVKGTIFRMQANAEVSVVVIRGEVELYSVEGGTPSPGPGGTPLAVLGPGSRATMRGGQVGREATSEKEAAVLRMELILKRDALNLDLAHF